MQCQICQHEITGEPMSIGLPEPDGRNVTYVEPVCPACHAADATSPEGLVRWGDSGVETVTTARRRTNSCGVEWFVEHVGDTPTGRVSYCRDAEGQHMWIDAAPCPDRQHAESYSPLTIT